MMQGKQRSIYDSIIFKLLFVVLFFAAETYWRYFVWLSNYILPNFSIVWILCLYRGLNKNKISVQNQFGIAFWVRMGWATCYNIYNTGKLYTSKQDFAILLTQCFITTAIFTALPLSWIQYLWKIKIFRWIVFVLDNSVNNGLKFIPLFRAQFLQKTYTFCFVPILVMLTRATARPTSQIITAHFNKNLTIANRRKWMKIGYLNSMRILSLCLINYVMVRLQPKSPKLQQNMQYFNLCYYGVVGYLMYLEAYTL